MKEKLILEGLTMRNTSIPKQKRITSITRLMFEIILIGIIVFGYIYMNSLITEYKEAFNAVQVELDKTRNELNSVLTAIGSEQEGILPSSSQAISTISRIRKELDTFRNRAELYDKYEYVIFYDGKRTDMKYSMVAYGENIMKKENIDPNMLFGLVMVESRGKEKAQNPTSSARGFCQLIDTTAKSLYEKVLNKGSYRHDYAFNGYINLELGAKLIAGNMEEYRGNTYTTIQLYRGIEDVRSYYTAVDKFVSRGGTSLRQIENNYRR